MSVFYDARSDVWIASRFVDVQAILRDHRNFSSSVLGWDNFEIRSPEDGAVLANEETLLASNPPHHDDLRRLVAKLFTPARLALCETAAQRKLGLIIEELSLKSGCEVVSDVCTPVIAAVMAVLFGVDEKWIPQVVEWLRVSGECNARSKPDSLLPRFESMLDEIWKMAQLCPHAGLGTFMAAKNEGDIDARHVLDLAVTLMKGGADTTTYLVGNVLAMLEREPSLKDKARKSPEIIPALIEDSLQQDSPVQLTVRLTTADVEVGGQWIPSNSRIILMLGSANLDEARTGSHIAFGAGSHRCPGAALARVQGRLILQALLTQLPDFRITTVRAVELWALRGYERMDIEFLQQSSNSSIVPAHS